MKTATGLIGWWVAFLSLGSCSFDLTDVPPEVRSARLSILVAATGRDTVNVQVYFDPGTRGDGAVRTFLSDSIVLNGVPHPPAEVEGGGARRYDVTDVNGFSGVIALLPPQVVGLDVIPALSIAPLTFEAPDTLVGASTGVLELSILGANTGGPWRGGWTVRVFASGQSAPSLSLAGQFTEPALLQVPVTLLPTEARSGHVDVSAFSAAGPDQNAPVPIDIHRMARAVLPFIVRN